MAMAALVPAGVERAYIVGKLEVTGLKELLRCRTVVHLKRLLVEVNLVSRYLCRIICSVWDS